MKVSKENLLLVAGFVWLIAGINVINIGLQAYLFESISTFFWILLLATLVIFVAFHVGVFTKMVGKHTERIRGYEEDKL